LELEKSLVWPVGAYCERCWRPISWRWAVPVVGWFAAGARCPKCKTWYPIRGVFVALLTAAGFVAIYWLHFQSKGSRLPPIANLYWSYGDSRLLALCAFHAMLWCLLVAATFTDLDYTIIPKSITDLGALLAVAVGAMSYIEVWPVPLAVVWHPRQYGAPVHPGQWFDAQLWPHWFGDGKTIPAWLEAFRANWYLHWALNWTKYLGVVTAGVGWGVGWLAVSVLRWVCSWALRKEAMGIGDVYLLAMIGAFLGWQTAVMTFVISWASGAALGLPLALMTGGKATPFGPHIAIGAVVAVAWWKPLWLLFAPIFESFQIFLIVAVGMAAALAIVASTLQAVKRLFRPSLGASAA
jgi:leader peptidase (prepilin peptidase)/N-methyltransferase